MQSAAYSVLKNTQTAANYTLSLHDALPISGGGPDPPRPDGAAARQLPRAARPPRRGPRPLREAAEPRAGAVERSEEHTSELQSQFHLVCRLLLEKKKISGVDSCIQLNAMTK